MPKNFKAPTRLELGIRVAFLLFLVAMFIYPEKGASTFDLEAMPVQAAQFERLAARQLEPNWVLRRAVHGMHACHKAKLIVYDRLNFYELPATEPIQQYALHLDRDAVVAFLVDGAGFSCSGIKIAVVSGEPVKFISDD